MTVSNQQSGQGLVKNSFTFQFIGNACGIFTGKNGTKILCDPWLIDGVFEGSWCHFPKLKTTLNDIKKVDAIYISHIHPDHFDERHFHFEKTTPIIVLDHEPNFLIKKLSFLGYINLLKIKDKQTVQFKEFHLTMFAPFSRHHFYEAKIGNLIDSALVVSCDGVSALNANDNVLSSESAEMLHKKYGHIDLAMLNYSAASSYPACFDNLSDNEKIAESNRIRAAYFSHLHKIISILRPRFFLPFAGSYVLGGALHHRNKYLATASCDDCASWFEMANIPFTKIILLREGNTFDIDKGIPDALYSPIDTHERRRYIEDELSKLRYPHEFDPMPNEAELVNDAKRAASLMKERMSRFGISSNFRVTLVVYGQEYQVYPSFKKLKASSSEDTLHCRMDERLLRRIFDKKANWNSAEGGAHISFVRIPNRYEPDLHTGLQFFHL